MDVRGGGHRKAAIRDRWRGEHESASNQGEWAWSARQVVATLRNPVYAGYLGNGAGIRLGEHPPIIDMDQFEAAGRALDSRRTARPKPSAYGDVWPLKGKIRCGQCGRPLSAHLPARQQGLSRLPLPGHCRRPGSVWVSDSRLGHRVDDLEKASACARGGSDGRRPTAAFGGGCRLQTRSESRSGDLEEGSGVMRSAGRIDPHANHLPGLNGLQRRETFREQRKQVGKSIRVGVNDQHRDSY